MKHTHTHTQTDGQTGSQQVSVTPCWLSIPSESYTLDCSPSLCSLYRASPAKSSFPQHRYSYKARNREPLPQAIKQLTLRLYCRHHHSSAGSFVIAVSTTNTVPLSCYLSLAISLSLSQTLSRDIDVGKPCFSFGWLGLAATGQQLAATLD